MKRSFTIGKRRPSKTGKTGQSSGRNGGTAKKITSKCRIRKGPLDLASQLVVLVYLVYVVSLFERDKPDEQNEPDKPASLRLASMKNPVLYFEGSSSRLTTDTVCGEMIRGTIYA